jgi:hypothetical protein
MRLSRCSIFWPISEVDGHTITPGYEYDAAKKDMVKRLNLQPENFFLTRKATVEKFARMEEWMNRYTFFGTPVYFEFLAGHRDLTCSAWAIPTRNLMGWKAPCYFMTDCGRVPMARALQNLRRDAGESGLGQIRRRRWRGARSALRELHDPLRL